MKYHTLYNCFTGLYDSTLLGGEFANCHGQGGTPEESIVSLKLTLRAMRNNKQRGLKK